MRASTRFQPRPATVLSALALFFALGGSAFALGGSVLGPQALTAAQARCANGAVRGIAVVTGEPTKGIAGIPATFTANGRLFNSRFNCSGQGVQVRRVGTGVFEVRFPGSAALSAVANALGPAAGPVGFDVVSPGVFRVYVKGQATTGNILTTADLGFILVAV